MIIQTTNKQVTTITMKGLGEFTILTTHTSTDFEAEVLYRKKTEESYLTFIDGTCAKPEDWTHDAYVESVIEKLLDGYYENSEAIRTQIISNDLKQKGVKS